MSDNVIAHQRFLLNGVALKAGLISWNSAAVAAAANGDLYVVAEIVGKPEKADELRSLIVPFPAKARKEPGCREYRLMEVESEPGRFLTFERWADHAALDNHMKTPAMASLGPKLGDLLAKPFTQTFLLDPKMKQVGLLGPSTGLNC